MPAFVAAQIVLAAIAPLWTLGAAADRHPSRLADQLFESWDFPRLLIEISDGDMDLLRGATRKTRNAAERVSVRATVREGTLVYTNVALQLKGSGGSFRAVDLKPALTLHFDKFAEGQRFHGLQKISLNNSAQDSAFLCEQIGREMFTAAGIPVPRATHATVKLNGRSLVLFVLLEGWNKQFLKRHFADPGGVLYEGSIGTDITGNLETKLGVQPGDRDALNQLAAAAREPNLEKRCAAMARVLDLDRFITGMAMEFMIGHWDGYTGNANNFRIYHDPTSNKLIFLPHGMDQLFGTGRSSRNILFGAQTRGSVSSALLETQEGRRRCITRMAELQAKVFDLPTLTNRVREISSRLRPLLTDDLSALRSFNSGVARLLQNMPERFDMVREQLSMLTAPLRFPPSGGVTVQGWTSWRDGGNPGFPRNDRIAPESLQILGGGQANSGGSWRAMVLLESGDYRFEARVKMENLLRGATLSAGTASLRTSEGASATSTTNALDWTRLAHSFTLASPRYVSLIAEYRGNRGRAYFDAPSLKLVRVLDKAPGK